MATMVFPFWVLKTISPMAPLNWRREGCSIAFVILYILSTLGFLEAYPTYGGCQRSKIGSISATVLRSSVALSSLDVRSSPEGKTTPTYGKVIYSQGLQK